MIDETYRSSPLHKLPAGLKLVSVFLISILLFAFPSIILTGVFFVLSWISFPMASFSWLKPWQQLRGILWLFIALFVLQLFNGTIVYAFLITLRLATLFLMACLVSLTTPAAKMLETFECIFSFTKYLGGNPAKISLALSLTLRFIPIFTQITQDVREAQKARGMEKNFMALLVPVLIRTIKMQDDVASAIEARCYDAERHQSIPGKS